MHHTGAAALRRAASESDVLAGCAQPSSLECCGSFDWYATLVQVPLRFMIFPTLEYLSSPKIQVHGRHGSTAMTSSTIFNILHELDELPLGLDGLDVPRWLILSFGT